MDISTTRAALTGHQDARSVVRLTQCSFCSLPLRTPVTLPCGNSLCRQCLPPSHLREYVTYPPTEHGHYGITCPFAECQKDHPVEDCSVNVVLSNVLDSIFKAVSDYRPLATKKELALDEIISWPPPGMTEEQIAELSGPEKGQSLVTPGGRLLASLDFASGGQLHYTSDIAYHPQNEEAEDPTDSDDLLVRIKDLCRQEVDCEVCYNMMLDPLTTPCGHTFCRKCLAQNLDHSNLCAVCRRRLHMGYSLAREPSNTYLNDFLRSFWPDKVVERMEALAIEERSTPEGLDTPIFVCSNAFPGMRTFLHIFEPRYRLLMRRAMETNRLFGMVAYNQYLEPQDHLGRIPFLQVGTMLRIENYQLFEDGRSFVQCQGVYRFKVRAHGSLDGYVIANVEKLEDISMAEEEAIEASEVSAAPSDPGTAGAPTPVNHMSTAELLEVCQTFIRRGQESSQRWFSSRLLETYGEPPDNAEHLPFWLAAILPFHEVEKYKVLPTTSVRERLKITVQWIRRIEQQRW